MLRNSLTSPTSGSSTANLKELYQRKALLDELIRKLERYADVQPKPIRKPPASARREGWTDRLAS